MESIGSRLAAVGRFGLCQSAVGCKTRLQAANEQLVFAKAHNNAGQIADKQSKSEQAQTDLLEGAARAEPVGQQKVAPI